MCGVVEEPALSIIIVNWNVKPLLADCLGSIERYGPQCTFDVWVVDNHSSDGSAEELPSRFPSVKWVQNSANVGFACANNEAIRRSAGRYLCILNPDTLWLDSSLDRLVRFLDTHPQTGVVGPCLLSADRQTVQYWGGRRLPLARDILFEVTRLGTRFPASPLVSRMLMPEWDHRQSRDVECLSGSCMLIRREVVAQVGLLDEGYPLYWEDTDWCHRILRAGWKLHYLADAVLVHLGRQSSLQDRGASAVRWFVGASRYAREHFDGPSAAALVALFRVVFVARLIAWTIVAVAHPNNRVARAQVRTYRDLAFHSLEQVAQTPRG